MQFLALLLFIVTVALPPGLLGLSRPTFAAEAIGARPDIVVLYLDDVDPHDGRLWNDPVRTPTLAKLFAQGGVAFSQAIAETPLCSPGRASTLTGQHTLNHGVNGNLTAPFGSLRQHRQRTGRSWLPHHLRGQVPQRPPLRHPRTSGSAACGPVGRIRRHLRGQRAVPRLRPVDARGHRPLRPRGGQPLDPGQHPPPAGPPAAIARRPARAGVRQCLRSACAQSASQAVPWRPTLC